MLSQQELSDIAVLHSQALDAVWLILNSVVVFSMQIGFLMIEVGSVNRIWQLGTVIKNLEDLLSGVMSFGVIGYSLAFSETSNSGFAGNFEHALLRNVEEVTYGFVFFQMCFVGTAATIVSGCVLDRLQNTAYTFYSLFISAIQYPIVTHWVWNVQGWLAKMGFIDFAGSGVVHMTGGISGLVFIILLGPRNVTRARRRGYVTKSMEDKPNPFLVAMGCLLLWVGWFGFNCGSTFAIASDGAPLLVGLIALNVIVSAVAAGFTASWISKFKEDFDVFDIANSFLAGLVAITSACHAVSPGTAAFCGMLGTLSYLVWNEILDRLEVDDPLRVTGIHVAGGIMGVLNYGLFADEVGLVYGTGRQFGIQLVGILAIAAWNGTLAFIAIKLMSLVMNLRVTIFDEMSGQKLYLLQPDMCLQECIAQQEPISRNWLLAFHEYLTYNDKEAESRLDYLLSLHYFMSRVLRYIRNTAEPYVEGYTPACERFCTMGRRITTSLRKNSRAKVIAPILSDEDVIQEAIVLKEQCHELGVSDGDVCWFIRTAQKSPSFRSESELTDKEETELLSTHQHLEKVLEASLGSASKDVIIPFKKFLAEGPPKDILDLQIETAFRISNHMYKVEWANKNKLKSKRRSSVSEMVRPVSWKRWFTTKVLPGKTPPTGVQPANPAY